MTIVKSNECSSNKKWLFFEESRLSASQLKIDDNFLTNSRKGLRHNDDDNASRNDANYERENEYFITSITRSSHRCIPLANRGEKRKKAAGTRMRYSTRGIRTSYLPLAIMASAMWWCYAFDNCVKTVEADQTFRCPSDCECYNQFKEVHCTGKGLRTIPPEVPPSSRTLRLSNNNIGEISRYALRQLKVLKKLQLDGNRINEIQVSAFYGLRNLQHLDLSGNKLTKVPREALTYLKSLQELNLRSNPITAILSFDFVRLRSSLRILDVGELRHLTRVSQNAMNGLDKLQILRMDSCGLTEIPSLSPLTDTLDLSFNKIRSIDANSFRGFHNLTTLSLAYCDIRRVDENSFSQMESLREMNLAGNNMTSLSASVFDNNREMTSLQLQRNPWMCNCDLLSLAAFISDNVACAAGTCPTCKHPIDYRGVSLKKLTKVPNLPCAALIVSSNAQASMNVSAGDGIKIPCPTLNPNDNYARSVKWFHPSGRSYYSHGRYTMRIKKLDNGSLNFTKVTLQDEGLYTCSVTLPTSEVENATVYLNVTEQTSTLISTFLTTETITIKTPSKLQTKPYSNRWVPTTPTTKPFRNNMRTSVHTSTATNRFEMAPQPKVPQTTPSPPQYPRESVDQVMETTKIIIGCFVGITLVAAALLIIFYKLRKKNYASRRQSNEECDGRSYSDVSDHRVESDISEKNTTTCHNAITQFDNNITSPLHMMASSASLHTGTINATAEPRLNNMPQLTRPNPAYLPPSAVHVLPPPPEELTLMRQQTRATDKLKTQQLLFNNSRSIYENRGNHCNTYQGVPKPPELSNTVSSPDVSKQLLSSLASSCQQVALKRRSAVNIDTSAPEMSSRVQQTQEELKSHLASGNNKSCENLKRSTFQSYPCVDEDISAVPDIDFTKGRATFDAMMSHKSNENVINKKRKIPIKMRSLEGLLNHKETEI